jgi:hypothetical protein
VFTTLIGLGDGTFGPSVESAPLIASVSPQAFQYKVAIADFDGDGLPDLVYSDNAGFLYLMKGDDKGDFGAPVPVFAAGEYQFNLQDIFVYDLNGDGHPDLVGPGFTGLVVVLGEGGGKFAPPVTYNTYSGVHLADFDGDGHVDAISCGTLGTTGSSPSPNGTIYVSYGRTDGTFGDPVAVARIPNHEGTVTGVTDLHGDSKNRIVVASPDGVTIALGATPGTTETYAGAFAQSLVSFSLTNEYLLGDFNEDGYTDIAMPANNALAILYGKADGTFNGGASIETGGYIGVSSLQLVDVTGDHIPDAVTSTTAIFRGNGDGTFTPLPNYNTFTVDRLLYTADFNGDGNVDILTNETIYYGQGNGDFTNSQPLSGLGNAPAFAPVGYYATGDFNNDGKPDVAASMESNSNQINGISFAVSAPGPEAYTYTYVSMQEIPGPLGSGDFTGDHCADLAVAGQTQIFILKSDCAGNFTQIGSYATGYSGTYISPFSPSFSPTDIAVVDLDGDGNLDIVYTVSSASIARVLYGKGDGTFTEGADIQLLNGSEFVTAGDLDGDGRPDLVFSGPFLVTVLHGEPNRTFSAAQYLAAGYQSGKPVLADLRLSGHLDIGIPNLGLEGNLSNEQGYSFSIFLNPLAAVLPTTLNAQLTVNPEPSLYGQPFTATAVFTPADNTKTPTGTASFTLDGGSATPGSLNATGTAAATFPLAPVGSHTVAVSYPGDSNFSAVSASVTHMVTAIPTQISLTCQPGTVPWGGTSQLLATVTSANGTPTGTISFMINGAAGATGPLVNGTMQSSFTSEVAGTQLLTATYKPTGGFAGSTASCQVQVELLPTNSVLTVAPAAPVFGAPLMLTATVSLATTPPEPAPGAPTGSVTFYNGAAALGSSTLANGMVTLSAGGLAAGSYNLGCQYSGDTNFAGSNCKSVQVVIAGEATALALSSNNNPATALNPVTLTARLKVDGHAAGAGNAITLTIDGQTNSLVTDATGSASYTISTLTPNNYPVTASFAGGGNLLASSASLTEIVNPAATTTTLTATPQTAYVGQTVTLVATVSAQNGAVTFFDRSQALGTVPVSTPGTASLATTGLAVGSHTLTASFVPASIDFVASTSASVNVVILASGFTITISPNKLTLGPGATGTVAIQLASAGNFAGPLALSYGAVPTDASASVSPATVTLTQGASASSTLTLETLLKSSNRVPVRPRSGGSSLEFAAATLVLLPLGLWRRNTVGRLVGLVLVTSVLGVGTGCTNAWHRGEVVAAGTYQIPVTATDVRGNAQTATLTVVVKP